MSTLSFPGVPETAGETDGADRLADRPNTRFLQRLRSGDLRALDAILAEYWSAVERYAARMLDDRDAGQDIALETFIRLWTHATDWRVQSLRGLVFRIARNLCIDEQRRRGAEQRALAREATVAAVNAAPAPDEMLERDNVVSEVDEAIQSLPDRRREAFTLVHLNGLSYREAARIMGLSVKTVSNHLGAALAQLRERLRPTLIREYHPSERE
jgi:RNA polymerase sigma-70 factor, ECF subfamily